MGRRGPPPTPTHLKVLKGNPGKRALPENEPKPQPIAPTCPAWLDVDGKREWKRVAPLLEDLGLLTQLDGGALAAYCQAYSMLVKAQKAIRGHVKETGRLTRKYTNNNGGVNEVAIPEIAIARQQLMIIRAFCAEFGMTPSARSRIEVELPAAPQTPGSPFEEYLNRGRQAKNK